MENAQLFYIWTCFYCKTLNCFKAVCLFIHKTGYKKFINKILTHYLKNIFFLYIYSHRKLETEIIKNLHIFLVNNHCSHLIAWREKWHLGFKMLWWFTASLCLCHGEAVPSTKTKFRTSDYAMEITACDWLLGLLQISTESQQVLRQLATAAGKHLATPLMGNMDKATRKVSSVRTETREGCYNKKVAFKWEYGGAHPPEWNWGKAGVVGK